MHFVQALQSHKMHDLKEATNLFTIMILLFGPIGLRLSENIRLRSPLIHLKIVLKCFINILDLPNGRDFFCLSEPGAGRPWLWEKIARKSIKLGKSDWKFKSICKYFGLLLKALFFLILGLWIFFPKVQVGGGKKINKKLVKHFFLFNLKHFWIGGKKNIKMQNFIFLNLAVFTSEEIKKVKNKILFFF